MLVTGRCKDLFGFAISDLRTFFGLEKSGDFFWVKDFGKDFF